MEAVVNLDLIVSVRTAWATSNLVTKKLKRQSEKTHKSKSKTTYTNK